MVPAGGAPAGALAAVGAQPDSPQQELVGSQAKRLRNNRCKRPSRPHASQLEPQLQVMLLKQRWCNLLRQHFSWPQLSLQLVQAFPQAGAGHAGWQGCTQTGTLRHTLTHTVSGTQTLM